MYGKIVTKEEADNLFGPVLDSIEISASDLLTLIKQTVNGVLFNIINGELIILGDGRKALMPAGTAVAAEVVFHHYSKEIVLQLINSNSAGPVYVEQRKDKLTVTCGVSTMEWGTDCPPNCP